MYKKNDYSTFTFRGIPSTPLLIRLRVLLMLLLLIRFFVILLSILSLIYILLLAVLITHINKHLTHTDDHITSHTYSTNDAIIIQRTHPCDHPATTIVMIARVSTNVCYVCTLLLLYLSLVFMLCLARLFLYMCTGSIILIINTTTDNISIPSTIRTIDTRIFIVTIHISIKHAITTRFVVKVVIVSIVTIVDNTMSAAHCPSVSLRDPFWVPT